MSMFNKIIILLLFLIIFSSFPAKIILAADGEATVPDQSTSASGEASATTNFFSYIQFLYPFGLSVAAILAVFMLVFAGLQMMAAAGNPGMIESAKGRISAAILGLLIAVGSYVILRTMNPDLVRLRLTVPTVNITSQTPTPTPDTPIENTQKITGPLNTGIDACIAGGGTPATYAGGFLCLGREIEKQRINNSADENNCRRAGGTVHRNVQFRGGGGGTFCSKEYK